MTKFRLDVSRETGAVTLWMAAEETPCGFRPVIGWPDMDGVREFAEMLLDIYRYRNEERNRVKQVSEDIISQALEDSANFLKEDFND